MAVSWQQELFAAVQQDDAQQQVAQQQVAQQQNVDNSQQVIEALQNEIAQLKQQLETLRTQQTQPAPKEEPSVNIDDIAERYLAKLKEDYGDEVATSIRDFVKTVVGDVRQKVESLGNQVNMSYNVAMEAKSKDFIDRLTQLVPNWRDIDRDKTWLDWLQESPSRAHIFKQAAQSFDADTVANLMQMFMIGQTNKPSAIQQVAPGRSMGIGNTYSSVNKRIWTKSEIAELYRNKAKYAPETFKQLELDVFEAQREGRVDYSK